MVRYSMNTHVINVITAPEIEILITYTLRKMGETKTSCKQFISSFISCTDTLRSQLSANVCNQILGTQQRSHLNTLQNLQCRLLASNRSPKLVIPKQKICLESWILSGISGRPTLTVFTPLGASLGFPKSSQLKNLIY